MERKLKALLERIIIEGAVQTTNEVYQDQIAGVYATKLNQTFSILAKWVLCMDRQSIKTLVYEDLISSLDSEDLKHISKNIRQTESEIMCHKESEWKKVLWKEILSLSHSGMSDEAIVEVLVLMLEDDYSPMSEQAIVRILALQKEDGCYVPPFEDKADRKIYIAVTQLFVLLRYYDLMYVRAYHCLFANPNQFAFYFHIIDGVLDTVRFELSSEIILYLTEELPSKLRGLGISKGKLNAADAWKPLIQELFNEKIQNGENPWEDFQENKTGTAKKIRKQLTPRFKELYPYYPDRPNHENNKFYDSVIKGLLLVPTEKTFVSYINQIKPKTER